MTTPQTDIFAAGFVLADHAAVESGKVYIQGGFWNRLFFPSFPAVTHFGVAAILHVPWRAYHQTHKFSIWFEDADGGRVGGEMGGEFSVGTSPDMRVGDETIMPVSAMINNFAIERPGDFAAVLSVDGAEISRWPFRAVHVPAGFGQAIAPPGDGGQ